MSVEEAAAFLSTRYGSDAVDVQDLGGGDWSRAFSFRLAGRELVVRFGRYLADFRRDREAMAFSCPLLPVPEVLEIGETGDLYYAVSVLSHGVFLEALDEAGWRRVMPPLLEGLDALRAISPSGTGVDWSAQSSENSVSGQEACHAPDWREWLADSLEDHPGARVSGWRGTLHHFPEVERLFATGERALDAMLQACPEVRHILHRDLLNRNVLVSDDASRLEAVFDWGCSVAGDYLYEAAWFTFWSPWYPALDALNVRDVFREHYRKLSVDEEDFQKRMTCYELQIGLEHIAYCAFTRRDGDLLKVARRTSEILRSPLISYLG
jgi:hygromycin-B 4-O-kinase